MRPALPRWKSFYSIALIAWITLVTSACREAGSARTDPPARQAILIILDAARADRFGFGGYVRETSPHLDRLARGGLIAPAHFAHATHTRGSLPGLLYSRYFAKALFPSSDSVPYDEPETLLRGTDGEAISLSRLLANNGFATAAISAHSWLKPGTPFAREFDTLVDLSAETGRYAPPAERVIDRAIAWIDDHREDDYFLYLHLMDTHFPHEFGPEARSFWDSEAATPAHLDGRSRTFRRHDDLDATEHRYLDALYDGSLLKTDRQIERLSSHLAESGLDRDTLIVVTSDHGEHLFETPGRFAHGGDWLDPVAHIPLIFFYPSRLEPATLPGFSGLVDVAPTILRLLEVPVPDGKSMDGQDLVAIARGEAPVRRHVLSPDGMRTERYKLLVDSPAEVLAAPDQRATPQPDGARLFDLSLDPHELQDVASQNPTVVHELAERYRAELGSKWTRFLAADADSQPETPFAIGARHFEVDQERVTEVGPDSEGPLVSPTRDDRETPSRWLFSRHWRDDWIMGRAGTRPLEISFPLPDGHYDVTARIRGSGAIQLSDGPPLMLSESDQPTRSDRQVQLGSVEVRGQRFSSTLFAPPTDGRLRVKLLGFRPAAGQNWSDDADAMHLEQLRALGYVE